MTSKTTSEPLLPACSYRPIINLESKPDVPVELESFDAILRKAEKLTFEIDTFLSSRKPPRDKDDLHRITITVYWIITSILAHSIYSTINITMTAIKGMDATTQRKLEIDCIALNTICHELYDLSRLYLGLFRVLTVKIDKSQYNQHHRLYDLVIAKSEAVQIYMCLYLERLSSAIGHESSTHPLTAGADKALKNVGLFTKIMNATKSMILMPPARKLDAYVQSESGRKMIEWLAITLRSIVKMAAPPLIGGVLDQALTLLHPVDYLHQALKPESGKPNLPSTSEFVTLRMNGGEKTTSSVL